MPGIVVVIAGVEVEVDVVVLSGGEAGVVEVVAVGVLEDGVGDEHHFFVSIGIDDVAVLTLALVVEGGADAGLGVAEEVGAGAEIGGDGREGGDASFVDGFEVIGVIGDGEVMDFQAVGVIGHGGVGAGGAGAGAVNAVAEGRADVVADVVGVEIGAADDDAAVGAVEGGGAGIGVGELVVFGAVEHEHADGGAVGLDEGVVKIKFDVAGDGGVGIEVVGVVVLAVGEVGGDGGGSVERGHDIADEVLHGGGAGGGVVFALTAGAGLDGGGYGYERTIGAFEIGMEGDRCEAADAGEFVVLKEDADDGGDADFVFVAVDSPVFVVRIGD